MKNTLLKRNFLSRSYFVVVGVMLLTILSLSCWFYVSIFTAKEEFKNQSLLDQSRYINKELTRIFDYVHHLMELMGKKIVQDKISSVDQISELLKKYPISNEIMREQFAWTVFDWSDTHHKMRVSTMYGVLDKPLDISHRMYASLVDVQPWKIHFDPPGVAIPSGEISIPAAMGVQDEKGKFLGNLSMAFNIVSLAKNLELMTKNKAISFVILHETFGVALHSLDLELEKVQKHQFDMTYLPNSSYGFLVKPINIGGVTYSVYNKLNRYPFTILLGYNDIYSKKEFLEILYPGILSISVIGMVSLILLLLLRYLLVSPIIRLSQSVDDIMAGNEPQKLKGYKTYEIFNLAVQVLKLKYIMRKRKVEQENLERNIDLLNKCDRAQKEFSNKINQYWDKSLDSIYHQAEVILNSIKGKNNVSVTMNMITKFIENIIEEASTLKSFTLSASNPRYIDAQDAIDRCIAMSTKMAQERFINLSCSYSSERLPLLYFDELCFYRIIQALIFQAIECSPRGANVKVLISTNKEKNVLCLAVKDEGFFLNDQKLKYILEMSSGCEFEQLIATKMIELPLIQKFMEENYPGYPIKIDVNTLGNGKTITLHIPFSQSNIRENTTKSSEANIYLLKSKEINRANDDDT